MENVPLPFPISTSRLLIRQALRGDMRGWSALYRSPKPRRHLNGPLQRSAKAWWTGQQQVFSNVDQPLSIALRETDELVGVCGYLKGSARGEWEVWLILRAKFWRKGIGAEVVDSLVNTAFNSLGATRVIGIVDPSNHASVTMIKKLGFGFVSNYSGNLEWQIGHQIFDIQKK